MQTNTLSTTADVRTTARGMGKGKSRKPRPSVMETLAEKDLLGLRLDEASRADLEVSLRRFVDARSRYTTLDSEDASNLSDDQTDELAKARSEFKASGLALVHFCAPRILRLRDSEAKRRWRSILVKFRKDEGV